MAACRGAAGWSFPATVALAFVPCILQTHHPPKPGLWGHVFARGRLCWAGRCDRSGQPGSCLLPQDRLTSPNQAVTASRGQEIQRQCPVHAMGLSKVPALQLKAPQAPDRRVCRWSPIPGAA